VDFRQALHYVSGDNAYRADVSKVSCPVYPDIRHYLVYSPSRCGVTLVSGVSQAWLDDAFLHLGHIRPDTVLLKMAQGTPKNAGLVKRADQLEVGKAEYVSKDNQLLYLYGLRAF